jgi:hypothetical protein
VQAGGAREHVIEHCAPRGRRCLVDHAGPGPFHLLSTEDPGQRSLVEGLIFASGRPVLLLPEGATRQLASTFDTVAVAWDHSRSATRAVAVALPVLQAAKHVHVVTVVDEKRLPRAGSGVELCKHLARHGVEVTFEQVQAKGRRSAMFSKRTRSSATSTCW